jgi:hypothetical protein
MQNRNIVIFVFGVLFSLSLGCAHWSDPCNNKTIKKITSPDGNLELVTYYRECSSKTYTAARIEKPADFLRKDGEVFCYLNAWGDRHPIVATWVDGNNVLIKTSDALEAIDLSSPVPESCGNIKIKYEYPMRNETQTADDDATVQMIREALSDLGPCIDRFYQAANPNNNPSGEINRMIANGEHRSAVEWILGQGRDAKCPIKPATFEKLTRLSAIFDLKPGYLEGVKDLVIR